MQFIETVRDGLSNLFSDLSEWNRKRKLVTDQEQARIERAEIEARRKGQKEALEEYIQEVDKDVTKAEKERYLDELRGGDRTIDDVLAGGGEPSLPGFEGDFDPQMPGFEDSEADNDYRF